MMRRMSDKFGKEYRALWRNRRGNEFVEAAIVIPIITAVVMLILNLFVFYLNILVTSEKVHRDTWKSWDMGTEATLEVHHRNIQTRMASRGILNFLPECERDVRYYELNEDRMTRAKDLIHEK